MKPALLRAVVFVCAGVLASCVATGYRFSPGDAFEGHLIEGVPLYTQKRLECGPTALAMVLQYHGIRAEPDDIARELSTKRLGGSLAIDMLLYAKKRGLRATYYRGSIEDLRDKLKRNLPPVIFVDLGVGGVRVGHFMVVTGYDDSRDGVIVHSGKAHPEFIPYKTLERIWKRTGFATLLIEPAG